MNRHYSELSDEQWGEISPPARPLASPWGEPKPIPNPPCFEGILWVLRSGAMTTVRPNIILILLKA